MGKLLKFKRTRKTKARTKKVQPEVPVVDPEAEMAMQFAEALRAMVTDEEAEAFRKLFED